MFIFLFIGPWVLFYGQLVNPFILYSFVLICWERSFSVHEAPSRGATGSSTTTNLCRIHTLYEPCNNV